ncbi:O-unit flippase-like protein [Alloscardovia criceti]|uniref:O-unit flippase-like protein n=1 Tax=Alloscardovia criceti TaxID=356828 RepID=UPI000364042C|nr:O-unit flippase-like protein [Alloscardovia criceti]
MVITTKRADVIWNYLGTIVSMASGFVLLPLLMKFLSDAELGLWYVYIAIANLAMLFEFGFDPTFARNIVYVVSGARQLTANGFENSSVREGVDWHLLNVVIRASKLIYASIAGTVLILLSSIGTWYVHTVTGAISSDEIWISWSLFCISIVLNLYFLYSTTVLRGYGDIEGENKAKTVARIIQLVVTAVMLWAGWGLLGASIGYFFNALLMRFFALFRMRKHVEIEKGRRQDLARITTSEMFDVVKTVGHLAWRDGLVRLALFISTQATSILSGLYLGLAETGTYSVLLQLSNAIYNLAAAYPSSFFPSIQASQAEGDVEKQRRFISTGIIAYWGLYLIGSIGVCLVILPLLPIFKPGVIIDYPLYLVLSLYLGLLGQHSIFCNYIISMNEIPYLWGYVIASCLGVLFIWISCGYFGWGQWGIVLGPALSQLLYNNWKWPLYLCRRIGTTYSVVMKIGIAEWSEKIHHILHRLN